MKTFLREYFRFSKKERIGLTILLIGMVFFFWLPEWYKTKPVTVQTDTAMIRLMEASVSTQRWSERNNKFRGKGGYLQQYGQAYGQQAYPKQFYPKEFYRKQPYSKQPWYARPYPDRRTYAPRPIPVVEINTAGMAEWEALPGIGPVLAARILKYRDKLGGFTRKEQVKQTYGISDSLYRALQPYLQIGAAAAKRDTAFVQQVPNANTATRAELESAGIPEQIARSIVVYHSRYGLFRQMGDLRKIVLINDSLYQLLSGKLRVE